MLRSPEQLGESLPSQHSSLIDLDREPWAKLNESDFAFRHNLQGHPLFKIEHLADLSERVFEYPDYQRYFAFSERSLPKPELKRILRDSILNIGDNGRW